MRDLVGARGGKLTLVFESFAFKHGVPLDADFVFDVRVLPNPHYIRELRPLTGRDAPVADYLKAQPDAVEMLARSRPSCAAGCRAFEDDQRSYLTVAIGCTGGQHRSVYPRRDAGAALRRIAVRHWCATANWTPANDGLPGRVMTLTTARTPRTAAVPAARCALSRAACWR